MATRSIDLDARSRGRDDGDQRIVGTRAFSAKNLVGYLLLAVVTVYCLTPLYWLALAATKNNTDLFSSFGLWFADFNLLANLQDLATRENGVYLHWVANTVLYAGVGGAAGTLVSVAAGYALAKYRFAGRGLITAMVLGAVLVPQNTLALPLYLLISKVNLVNTYWAVLLPSMLFPIGVFLARIYATAAVPDELVDAARVDGAGEFRIFGRVALPLLGPAMVTIFLFQFVAIWNNFFLPFVVLNDPNLYPISVGLTTWNFDPASHELLYNLIVTGAFLAVLPLIALFIILQRFWRAGLAFGSIIG